MKKLCFLSAMILPFVLFQACNTSGGKGSKQQADSINQAKDVQPKVVSDFMEDAAVINLNEIKLGSMAQEQAATSRVKNFATMIVQDHKKVNSQLETLAQKKQVVLPHSLDQKHLSDAFILKDKKGQDFDETFVDHMVKGHKDAIDTYQKAEKDIQDPDVKSFIKNTLPGLQKHLDSAQAIQDAMKGNTRSQMDNMSNDNRDNDQTQKGMNQNNFNASRPDSNSKG